MEKNIKILEKLCDDLKQRPLNCDVYIREDDRNALEKFIKAYRELEKIEAEHQKTNGKLRVEVESLEKSLGVHDEIIARLEERLTENDKIVLDIIKRLENDIKNITATKYDGYTDDYRRCRLKAYKTKTREIKEYIEEKYFGKKVSEE